MNNIHNQAMEIVNAALIYVSLFIRSDPSELPLIFHFIRKRENDEKLCLMLSKGSFAPTPYAKQKSTQFSHSS